jgi:hypothetical protein
VEGVLRRVGESPELVQGRGVGLGDGGMHPVGEGHAISGETVEQADEIRGDEEAAARGVIEGIADRPRNEQLSIPIVELPTKT